MLGELEILNNGFVTSGALLRAHKFRSRYEGRRRDDAFDGGTRNHQCRNGYGGDARDCPGRFESQFIHNFFP